MRCPWWRPVFALAVLAAPLSAAASFHASDLIYLPAVAHNAGVESSIWRTDVFISNVDSEPIDIIMVYLPSGLQSNGSVFNDRSQWLGGREDEGFGFVNPALADIQPNATVVLEDVVGEYWEGELGLSGLGAMVVFALEAGSLEDDGSRVIRNAVVHARIYNESSVYEPDPDNEGEFRQVDVTYGQIIPGVPWYNLADPAAVSETGEFSFQILVGGVQNEIFRYNVGIVNASDQQTSITLGVEPFQANGDPYLNDQGNPVIDVLTLPPLAHVQFNQILSTLGIDDAEQVMIRVRFLSWNSSSLDPKPAFTSYGSYVDGRSNDPTTVVPSFASPFDVECLFPLPESSSSASAVSPRGTDQLRVSRRPLRAPVRSGGPN